MGEIKGLPTESQGQDGGHVSYMGTWCTLAVDVHEYHEWPWCISTYLELE
jgi:hypothetical protein